MIDVDDQIKTASKEMEAYIRANDPENAEKWARLLVQLRHLEILNSTFSFTPATLTSAPDIRPRW